MYYFYGMNFTIISTSNGQNSRVTFQKSAINAWEILVWAWDYMEMRETHAHSVRLESSGELIKCFKSSRNRQIFRDVIVYILLH